MAFESVIFSMQHQYKHFCRQRQREISARVAHFSRNAFQRSYGRFPTPPLWIRANAVIFILEIVREPLTWIMPLWRMPITQMLTRN